MRVFRNLDQLPIIDRLELINALLFKHLNQMQMTCKFRLRDPNQVAKEKNKQLLKTLKMRPRMPPQQTTGIVWHLKLTF